MNISQEAFLLSRNIESENQWREWISARQKSGIRIVDWCQQIGQKESAYHYWVKRLKSLQRNEPVQEKFVELMLPQKSDYPCITVKSSSPKISLCRGDYTINIVDGFNTTTLSEVLKVLQSL